MKITALCMLSLLVATVLVVTVGQGPTQTRWGEQGVRSLYAVAAICLGAALVGFIPVAAASIHWPSYIGQAALGATALRLLLTMIAGGAYQVMAKPHLSSFLFWALILYCTLLAIETGFGVCLIRRFYRPDSGSKEVPA